MKKIKSEVHLRLYCNIYLLANTKCFVTVTPRKTILKSHDESRNKIKLGCLMNELTIKK